MEVVNQEQEKNIGIEEDPLREVLFLYSSSAILQQVNRLDWSLEGTRSD